MDMDLGAQLHIDAYTILVRTGRFGGKILTLTPQFDSRSRLLNVKPALDPGKKHDKLVDAELLLEG